MTFLQNTSLSMCLKKNSCECRHLRFFIFIFVWPVSIVIQVSRNSSGIGTAATDTHTWTRSRAEVMKLHFSKCLLITTYVAFSRRLQRLHWFFQKLPTPLSSCVALSHTWLTCQIPPYDCRWRLCHFTPVMTVIKQSKDNGIWRVLFDFSLLLEWNPTPVGCAHGDTSATCVLVSACVCVNPVRPSLRLCVFARTCGSVCFC